MGIQDFGGYWLGSLRGGTLGVGEAPMVFVEMSGGDGVILGIVGDVSLVTAISVIRFQGAPLGALGRC